MINETDLEAFGYFDMFQNSPDYGDDPLRFYSQFVEDKVFTKGRERLVENTLGLVGESGEVAEKIKKIVRDGKDIKTESHEIAKELGDVLWYVAAVARDINYSLQVIAAMNIQKLESRKERGVLQGNGDNR